MESRSTLKRLFITTNWETSQGEEVQHTQTPEHDTASHSVKDKESCVTILLDTQKKSGISNTL